MGGGWGGGRGGVRGGAVWGAWWCAAVVVLVVGSAVAVFEVLLVMVPCTAVMNILVAVPRRGGWWCTPDAVALAARWCAAVVDLTVRRAVAVYEVVLAMVVCTTVIWIIVSAPRLVGVVVAVM